MFLVMCTLHMCVSAHSVRAGSVRARNMFSLLTSIIFMLAISFLTLFLCLGNFKDNGSIVGVLCTLLTCVRARNMFSLLKREKKLLKIA